MPHFFDGNHVRAQPFTLLFVVLAAFSVPAAQFDFVVIGDTRPRFESQSFRPFEGLIGQINSLHPALVVNLGDLIYGYGPASKEKQWDKYEAVVKTLHVPYYQVPGNHDTHSKEARRLYGRRFGRFYQSFDYGDCHFVLLDNAEDEQWGKIGPAQLDWLKEDLKRTQAGAVFVFLHFPVWEPERITPAYYEFWAQTLHPLFKQSRVRAVFGGHYHTYGPTREFDGIRYFITGGGGAELRPEYRKAGGGYHFMRLKVSGDRLEPRVVTEHGELTDPEADVMGGLQFAARHVSRIGIRRDFQELNAGVSFDVSVTNPYPEVLRGQANWLMDASSFSVEPPTLQVQIPVGATRQYSFVLKALRNATTLGTLPQLQFDLASGGKKHRFHREVRFLGQLSVPYHPIAPVLDGRLTDWQQGAIARLGEGAPPETALRGAYDGENLYLAITVPCGEADEASESGLSDELQLGMARRLSATDFGGDFLRLGFNSDSAGARDRTPSRKREAVLPGIRSVCLTEPPKRTFEIAIPLRLVKPAGAGGRLILDLSFPAPEPATSSEPSANTFSYRVRYGSDSLVPLHFVELTFVPKRQ